MKTTIDIPDELYHQARAQAELEGRTLDALMIEGLEHVMSHPARALRHAQFPLIKSTGTGQKITDDMVNRAEEQCYEEEAEHYAQFIRR